MKNVYQRCTPEKWNKKDDPIVNSSFVTFAITFVNFAVKETLANRDSFYSMEYYMFGLN